MPSLRAQVQDDASAPYLRGLLQEKQEGVLMKMPKHELKVRQVLKVLQDHRDHKVRREIRAQEDCTELAIVAVGKQTPIPAVVHAQEDITQ